MFNQVIRQYIFHLRYIHLCAVEFEAFDRKCLVGCQQCMSLARGHGML